MANLDGARAVTVLLDAAEARRLTDEVKDDAAALWTKMLTLYEGEAHIALGYSSWATYYEAEFGGSSSHGYRLLDAARVARLLPEPFPHAGMNARQADELVPVMRQSPEAVPVVWQQVQERTAGNPTAAAVRQAVRDWIADGREVERQSMAQATDETRARFAPERMRQQGEVMRLVRDIAALPDPAAYVREHPDLPARAVTDAEAAHAWLTDFLSEWRETHDGRVH